jgi:hypothetical protein
VIAGSDLEGEKTVRFFRESMSNRLNDEQSAIVIIMQRLHARRTSLPLRIGGFGWGMIRGGFLSAEDSKAARFGVLAACRTGVDFYVPDICCGLSD